MEQVKVYLVGNRYRLDGLPGEAVPVFLELTDSIRLARTGSGEARLFRGDEVYGKTIQQGLKDGWCRIASPES